MRHKVVAFNRRVDLDRVVTTSKFMGQFMQKLTLDPDNNIALTEDAIIGFEKELLEVVQVLESVLDGVRRSVD